MDLEVDEEESESCPVSSRSDSVSRRKFSKVVSWLELTFRIGRVCHAVIYMAEEPDIAVVALGHFVYCVSWLGLYNFSLRVVIR